MYEGKMILLSFSRHMIKDATIMDVEVKMRNCKKISRDNIGTKEV